MLFQFHIVRLKDGAAAVLKDEIRVSIPYSSIKSRVGGGGLVARVGFQFHIVRLKAISGHQHGQPIRFQFHIVRLKVTQAIQEPCIILCFNSI